MQIHLDEVVGTMNRSSNTDRPLPQLTTDERVMREDLDVSGYCLIENYARGLRPETFEKLDSVLLKKLGFWSWSGSGHTGNPSEEVISPGENALGPLYRDNNPTG